MTREHLQVTASRMCDWHDKKTKIQEFLPGDEVYVLNLRLYQQRCPKWLRRYTDVAAAFTNQSQNLISCYRLTFTAFPGCCMLNPFRVIK